MLQERNLGDDAVTPVWTWRRVVYLNLSHNKLEVLPDLDLPVLETLDISHNTLQQLPKRLRVPKLVYLDLSYNKIVRIPHVNPRYMRALETVDLSYNNLSEISANWLRGPRCTLKSLELSGNNKLRVPQSTIIERGGDKVCQFFRDLSQGRRRCWSQTMMVVGQEAAGKSALCSALLGCSCLDQEQMVAMSTVGIETVHWQSVVALPNSSRLVRVRVRVRFRVRVRVLWPTGRGDGLIRMPCFISHIHA